MYLIFFTCLAILILHFVFYRCVSKSSSMQWSYILTHLHSRYLPMRWTARGAPWPWLCFKLWSTAMGPQRWFNMLSTTLERFKARKQFQWIPGIFLLVCPLRIIFIYLEWSTHLIQTLPWGMMPVLMCGSSWLPCCNLQEQGWLLPMPRGRSTLWEGAIWDAAKRQACVTDTS